MAVTPELGTTERRNPATAQLDTLSTAELVALINREDHQVADAVAAVLPQVADAVDVIAEALGRGGRLIYVGAGTSGRIGVLDASECPPTFGTDPSQVLGLIAGGQEAIFRAVEGAEDSSDGGAADLEAVQLSSADVVVGLAASGRTPYVLGALRHAREQGATTISVACNRGAEVSTLADVAIEIDNGPEVLTGSTRMKAGTSQKLVLNMLSTGAMVRLGKVYGNLMVDLVPTNAKLEARAVRIVTAATGADADAVATALAAAGNHAKTAIVMLACHVDADAARERLRLADGFVGRAISADADPHTTTPAGGQS